MKIFKHFDKTDRLCRMTTVKYLVKNVHFFEKFYTKAVEF